MRTLKSTILFLLMSVMFMQQLQAQMFTAPYQAVNYQKVISNGLNFDGTDDYISLTRPVSDDFTIEFWMKTTQTGASGPYWYLSFSRSGWFVVFQHVERGEHGNQFARMKMLQNSWVFLPLNTRFGLLCSVHP